MFGKHPFAPLIEFSAISSYTPRLSTEYCQVSWEFGGWYNGLQRLPKPAASLGGASADLGWAPCTQQGGWHLALGHTTDLFSVCFLLPIRTLQGIRPGEISLWVSPMGTLGLVWPGWGMNWGGWFMGLLRSVLEAQRGTPLLFLVASARVSLMPSIGHSSALRALFLFLRAEAFSVLFVQCLKMSILFVCGECPEFWSSFGTMPLNCLIPEFLVILLRLFNCFSLFFFSCPAFPLAGAKPTTDRQCLILPLAFFFFQNMQQ